MNDSTRQSAASETNLAHETTGDRDSQSSSTVHTGTQNHTGTMKTIFDRVTTEVNKIYVGQDELVLSTLVALFSGGHVLIESVPGLGKTLFVKTLGKVLGCKCGRIQFTADLMPSDITGAPVFNMKTQEFTFRPGPVFTQLLLADEINRSPAKTHAALLEIMQEYRVTVERTTHKLSRPFLVLAGENSSPSTSDGDRTWPLVEAALPAWRLYGGRSRLGLFNHRQGHSIPPIAFSRLHEWLATYLRLKVTG